MSLVIWVVSALISLMGAFVYVELGTSIRKSGGDLAYLRYVKWYSIAFSYVGVGCVFNNPIVTAIGLQTFSAYIIKGLKIQFNNEQNSYWAHQLLSFSLLMPLIFLNFFSAKKIVSKFQTLAALFTLLSSSIVICIGFYLLIFKGETQNFQNAFANTTYKPGQIVNALFAGLFSYDGWDILNYGAEEVYHPRRNMPLSICIGLTIVTVFYLSMNISYYTVLSVSQILESNAVAVINYSSFATWSQRSFSISALLYIRHRHIKVEPDAIKMPIFMPILFLAICLALLIITVIQDFLTSVVGLSIIIGSWVVYFLFKWKRALPSLLWYEKKASQFNEKVAIYAQLLFDGLIDYEGEITKINYEEEMAKK